MRSARGHAAQYRFTDGARCGQIAKVEYQEGQLVHVGDPLVEIDPAPFQAAVTQAEGQLARDQAQLELAKINLERRHRLAEQGRNLQAGIRHANCH